MSLVQFNMVKNEPQPGMMAFDICRIELAELQEYVSIAFKEDADLITKYHFQDSTMNDLIFNTVKNIEELAQTKEVKCYGMFLEQTPIGFTVIAEKLLYSFGINVYCRNKEVKAVWVNWIKRVFDNNFVVCLYRENTRAINFFLKNGLEEFSDDGKVVYLITSKN